VLVAQAGQCSCGTAEINPPRRAGGDEGDLQRRGYRRQGQLAIKAFEIDYGAKYPKAVAKIVDDTDVLLEFYKYPAEHWIHLRTTNPIESTFATVRLRTKMTKGPGSRAAGLAMAYKLIEAAQTRWRKVNAPELGALVRAGTVFHTGKLLERPIDITPKPSAAEPQTAGSEVA
jgi:putative transposase